MIRRKTELLITQFYQQDAINVAQQLIGKLLIRETKQGRLYSRIIETEAYFGEEDTACHASKGRTQRTEVMYQSGGVAYIYLIYGMYHMLNIVTGDSEHPQAVLIRGIEPLSDDLQPLPNPPKSQLKTNGPGKLCRYLSIDKQLNHWDLTLRQQLWVEDIKQQNLSIATGPRIGIDYAHPKDRDKPWRFWLKDNIYVSK